MSCAGRRTTSTDQAPLRTVRVEARTRGMRTLARQVSRGSSLKTGNSSLSVGHALSNRGLLSSSSASAVWKRTCVEKIGE